MSILKSGGKTYTITGDAPYAPWGDTGGVMLTDGDSTWHDWRVGWLSNCNPIITIDLSENVDLDYVRFNHNIWNPAGIPGAYEVVVKGKVDGGSVFDTLGTFDRATYFPNTNNYPTGAWSSNLDVSGSYRYIQYDYNGSEIGLCLTELEVYAVDAPTTSIKTIFGLLKASVKSVNGLAIASVKSFNGLT